MAQEAKQILLFFQGDCSLEEHTQDFLNLYHRTKAHGAWACYAASARGNAWAKDHPGVITLAKSLTSCLSQPYSPYLWECWWNTWGWSEALSLLPRWSKCAKLWSLDHFEGVWREDYGCFVIQHPADFVILDQSWFVVLHRINYVFDIPSSGWSESTRDAVPELSECSTLAKMAVL